MSTSPRRRVPMQKSAPRMRKADRKRQLLIHAKHLFVTLGYQNTTTEKIARAAGVSEPVLYRHFENKKALFLEVLQEIRAATLNRWHAETVHLTDPLAKLHRIADLYLGTTREHALEFRIMHRTLIDTDDEEIAAFLQSFYLDSEKLLARVISEGQQTGVFRRSLDPRVGAWEIIRTALGYTLTLPLSIPLYAEPDYIGRAIDCLLHCLLKTDV
ncbi:MAG TPA: TetR/AcrR family transcriptional regulator [Gemmataceae bacterium]|nr:TetR/AcrR family transcriptional regulator [Gemmataceae bacterium]